ncbi:hypothetical protein PR202_ga29365 [Eleusine coracana subsp. coracana]|uniref:DUF7950 domain-containing protein n=1 Tax=Eleusine coracana subsp. coracana TaxID=191504 RepID=A0AAV5DKZ9_ELECO|nr:hypothetical protein PR202_ga29365 [Eleusine coracana subsp. coracana]
MAVVQPADMAIKANEILARFRPIAPKPSSLAVSPAQQAVAEGVVATNRVLCQLQSRPCRARKRGRPTTLVPAAKRKRAAPPYPPLRCAAATTTDAVTTATRAAHVSVVVPTSSAACVPMTAAKVAREEEKQRDVPVERDLLRKLLEPTVISPRAVRPVGSTIRVESITPRTDNMTSRTAAAAVSKSAADVEAELEADAVPAVVSDSSCRVRLVNEAYKEMHEQAALPESAHGVPFTCTATIEWECDGKCTSVSLPCDVTRLQCESRDDYLFIWKFRTSDADAPVSSRSGEMSES